MIGCLFLCVVVVVYCGCSVAPDSRCVGAGWVGDVRVGDLVWWGLGGVGPSGVGSGGGGAPGAARGGQGGAGGDTRGRGAARRWPRAEATGGHGGLMERRR